MCKALDSPIEAPVNEPGNILKFTHNTVKVRTTRVISGSSLLLLQYVWPKVQAIESSLVDDLIRPLRLMPGVTVYGIHGTRVIHSEDSDVEDDTVKAPTLNDPLPIVSFTHKDFSNTEIVNVLQKAKICAGDGPLGCPAYMRALGVPEDKGVVRISLAHYIFPREVEKILDTLEGLFVPKPEK